MSISAKYGSDDDDIVRDIELMLEAVKQRPPEERNEYGFTRLLSLKNRYAPVILQASRDELHASLTNLTYIEQVKKVRAVLGIGLGEAKDYVDNLKANGALS